MHIDWKHFSLISSLLNPNSAFLKRQIYIIQQIRHVRTNTQTQVTKIWKQAYLLSKMFLPACSTNGNRHSKFEAIPSTLVTAAFPKRQLKSLTVLRPCHTVQFFLQFAMQFAMQLLLLEDVKLANTSFHHSLTKHF